MYFDVYEYTSKGGRSNNEDCLCSRVDGDKGIFVLADGLGGHDLGELASKEICDTFIESWENGYWLNYKDEPDYALQDYLTDTISRANGNILEIKKRENTELKSTVVVLAIDGESALWANVGDSRLYHIRNELIKCCTNDHSVAFKKYKAGEISRDDIANDEDQSSLLRSLGGESRNEPEFYVPDKPVGPGNGFMLCSDGAWEYLYDEEVVFDYCRAESARDWARLLLTRIIDRVPGNHDNLSVLTVMVNE